MTGCPNGCSRPYNADIGLVGKTAGKYTIYLGGRLWGDRLDFVYKELVQFEEIVPMLVPVLAASSAAPRRRDAGRLLLPQGRGGAGRMGRTHPGDTTSFRADRCRQ